MKRSKVLAKMIGMLSLDRFLKDHPKTYRIYRVYDIFGEPILIEVNPDDVIFETDNYRMKIQPGKSSLL